MNGALRGSIAGLAFVSTVVATVMTLGNEIASRPHQPSNSDEATQPAEQKGPAIARRMRRASV